MGKGGVWSVSDHWDWKASTKGFWSCPWGPDDGFLQAPDAEVQGLCHAALYSLVSSQQQQPWASEVHWSLYYLPPLVQGIQELWVTCTPQVVFKRRGNYFRSIFLDPFSAPPSPDILRGAGKLSWASGLLRECLSQPTFAQVWRTRVLGHLSKTQGMSPTFFLFLPCSKRTSVPIWLGMSPPSYLLTSLPHDISVSCPIPSPGR